MLILNQLSLKENLLQMLDIEASNLGGQVLWTTSILTSWHPDNAVHISQLRFLVSQGSEASAKEDWFNTTLTHKKIEESLTCVLVGFCFSIFFWIIKVHFRIQP
jgi:hypothetical protein